MKTIGDQVRTLREKADISQNKLAALSGLTPEYIGKIERKVVKNIGIVTLGRIAKVLGVEPYELLKVTSNNSRV